MDLGKKIQNARLNSGMTQELVAENLGVSRQTISNWENNKTYPDIISVVRMSDLYHISLDALLKEEKTMSHYLEYLEESTNVVKSKEKQSKMILIVAYLSIWAFALIVFWFFLGESDALGYSGMFLWILLPVTTCVISLLIGKNNYWGRKKWLAVFFFGIMYMFAEYATFGVANMAAFQKINLPQIGMIPMGSFVSLLGMGTGNLMYTRRQKKKYENENVLNARTKGESL